MITLVYVLTIVYILAINFYAFTLLKSQKTAEESCQNSPVRDGKLLFTALLGGSVGIIISALITKHRYKSMFIIVLMPVLAVLNGYIFYLFLSSGINYLFAPTIEESVNTLSRFLYFTTNL